MTTILSKMSWQQCEPYIPDFTDWQTASTWIDTTRQKAKNCSKDCEIAYVDWEPEEAKMPFGLYQSKKWRQFVLATYAADLISYDEPNDQVNFDRLLYVMHAFPEGFRLWWIKCDEDSWIPCGYTGWYPMLQTAFDTFQTNPESVVGRMVVPVKESKYLYLFNYSVIPQLKKQPVTKQLLTMYSEDIAQAKPEGLACITVSPDGARVASRFGMKQPGVNGIYTVVLDKKN